MFKTIGFIGAGRVARIMLGGWQHAGQLPDTIRVFDQNPAAIEALMQQFPQVQAATLAECARCDWVFGALHPPALLEVLPVIAPELRPDALLVSLAPRLSLAVLQEKLGGFGRLARMNPNSPSIIGQGFNPIAWAQMVPAAERQALTSLLLALGQAPEVAENRLETYAVISAMGPTYFGFQFETLRQLAESFGLEDEAARAALRAMLHGTVELLFASEVPTNTALDLVPVRPLADDEPAIRQMLQTRIAAMHARLTS